MSYARTAVRAADRGASPGFEASFAMPLGEIDPGLASEIAAEERRNSASVNLIASESYCPRATLEAEASILVSKNVYGYPGRRGVAGCAVFDRIEELALSRACALFGARRANVQALSSTIANIAVFRSLVRAGETILSLDERSGGHHSHGAAYHLSGRDFTIRTFGVDEQARGIDFAAARRLALEHRPALIVAGSTSLPRAIDFAGLAAIAKEAGARLLADIAHVSGLVATGHHANPVGVADVVTTSTHKTLCGPRTGGLVLTDDDGIAEAIDAELFPGIQGAPGAHIIAGRAALFAIVARPDFRQLMAGVTAHARVLAEALLAEGLDLYLGGTDTHMLVIDLRRHDLDGLAVERRLEGAGLLANRVSLPGRPGDASAVGLRLGSTAMTIRGFGAAEFTACARALAEVIRGGPGADATLQELARNHPVPPAFLPIHFDHS